MKESMVPHDMAQSHLNKQTMQDQGKSVRKHNFHFGFHNAFESAESEYSQYKVIYHIID